MRVDPEHKMAFGGYVLWLVGSGLFMVSTARAGDVFGFLASSLFLLGILMVIVPMTR